jgi:hypothetical protein
MGRLINGINGPIQGKVGTVIGSSRNGIPYLKGPYKSRTPKISKKEKGNRSKFARAQFWLKPLLHFVREGFKDYSRQSQGFVAAKSYLLLNAFEGTAQDITINPSLVKVSFGDLPLSGNIAANLTGKNKLQFTWDTDPVDGASPYDQVMILAYDIKNAAAYFKITGQFRNTGSDVLLVHAAKGITYHLYVAFTAADRSRQSHSVYLGEIKL